MAVGTVGGARVEPSGATNGSRVVCGWGEMVTRGSGVGFLVSQYGTLQQGLLGSVTSVHWSGMDDHKRHLLVKATALLLVLQ